MKHTHFVYPYSSSIYLTNLLLQYEWYSHGMPPKLTVIAPHVLRMVEMDVLCLKFDNLQATMKDEMNAAVDERGVGTGSGFHLKNILLVIADSGHRMLSMLELPNATISISVMEVSNSLTIRNEDNEVDNIFEGMSSDEITSGGENIRNVKSLSPLATKFQTSLAHFLKIALNGMLSIKVDSSIYECQAAN